MTSKVTTGHLLPKDGSNRLESVLGRDTDAQNTLFGVETPRIHTPLNDLPSLGHELVDLATSIGVEMMPWQKFALIHTHKVKSDGRWATPVNCIVVAAAAVLVCAMQGFSVGLQDKLVAVEAKVGRARMVAHGVAGWHVVACSSRRPTDSRRAVAYRTGDASLTTWRAPRTALLRCGCSCAS